MSFSIHRSRQTFILIPVAIIITLLAGSPGRAIDENLTKGATNNHVFESGMWGENIDLLNGGLNLTIPLGPRYEVSADVSYQLQLSYSSKVWIQNQANGDPNQAYRSRSRLQGIGQAGLGFLLQLGRQYVHTNVQCDTFYDATVFQDATGATHTWYSTSGAGDAVRTVASDGSFLKFLGGGVTFPGGLRYLLGHNVNDWLHELDPNHVSSDWPRCPSSTGNPATYDSFGNDYRGNYVNRIEGLDYDPNGDPYNTVDITYENTDGMRHLMKTITDSRGRQVRFFNTKTVEDPNGVQYQLDMGYVERIEIPSYGASDPNAFATYTFEYVLADLVNPMAVVGDPAPVHHGVLLLNKVVFPDPNYTMTFEYQADEWGGINAGLIQARTIPTGARIEYDYASYPISRIASYQGTSYIDYVGSTHGIVTKRVIPNSNSPAEVAEWKYLRAPFATGKPNPSKVVMTDPYGNDTVTHFYSEQEFTSSEVPYDEDAWLTRLIHERCWSRRFQVGTRRGSVARALIFSS